LACIHLTITSLSALLVRSHLYYLSLHDALPILGKRLSTTCGVELKWNPGSEQTASLSHFPMRLTGVLPKAPLPMVSFITPRIFRSEEHTSELQSRFDIVCHLLRDKTTYSITQAC